MTRLPFVVAAATLLIPILSIAGELEDRTSMNVQVLTALQQGNFASLDALADTFQSASERTSSGLWKLQIFNFSFNKAFDWKQTDEAYWRRWDRTITKWINANPNSYTAHLAYARMLLNRGWSHRGGGFSNSVTPDKWALFNEYTERARSHLETSKKIAAKDPNWYALMITVGYRQSWPETRIASLFQEGLERNPYYQQIYFASLDYFAPKWGGSAEKIEEFARSAVNRTQAQEGLGMYARLYWYASQTQYGDKLFTNSKVDWPMMKRGMDDVLGKYPDQWNINNFAKLACVKEDPIKTANLLDRIVGKPILEAWSNNPQLFEWCSNWSMGFRAK